MNRVINVTPIVVPKGCVPQKYDMHRFSLQRVVLLSLVLWALSFVFSAEGLPDYDSYNSMYELTTSYLLFGQAPFFVYLSYLGEYFQLNYDEFRAVILFLSLTNFIAALYIFSRKLRGAVWRCRKQNMLFMLLVGLIFAFAFTVFFLEFFIIRIRPGLALSMVFLAFSLFWSGKKKSSKLGFAVVAVLLGLAFATHLWTTSILVYFTFYPVALSRLYSKRSFNRQGHFLAIISFFAVIIPAVLMVYALLQMVFYRGAHLFSKLNVFRLIALSIIPIIIVLFGVFGKKYIGLRSILKIQRSTSQDALLVPKAVRQLMMWHYFATFSYLSMASALLLFYMAGNVEQAGEAIVRLFTLSSPLAVFIVLCATKFYAGFWLFVLLSNSLFFVNTVFIGISQIKVAL